MAKPEDLIVISRKEIEFRLKQCDNAIASELSELKCDYWNGQKFILQELLSDSRPLTPLLEKAWDDGNNTSPILSWIQTDQAKQQFLSSEI